MYEVKANINLSDDQLGNISLRYYCDGCHEIVTVDPTFFQESGTPICGNDSCQLEGEDMEVIDMPLDLDDGNDVLLDLEPDTPADPVDEDEVESDILVED